MVFFDTEDRLEYILSTSVTSFSNLLALATDTEVHGRVEATVNTGLDSSSFCTSSNQAKVLFTGVRTVSASVSSATFLNGDSASS